MQDKLRKWGVFVLILALLLSSTGGPAAQASPSRQEGAPDQPQVNGHYFFPYVGRARVGIVYGSEIGSLSNQASVNRADEANLLWVRNVVLNWKTIEPVRTDPPTYDWSKVNESGLINASVKGLNVIATVKYTPEWAHKYPGYSCGPMAEDQIPAYAQFIHAAVERYSAPPYNVKYWELGNEPDVGRDGSNQNWAYGCWGEWTDPFFGGGYYATMLKQAYPAVKLADPQSRVLIGGLLLSCDRNYAPANSPCILPSYFFEGILAGGGGDYFDIVSYHGYPVYYGGKFHDEDFATWATTGGVVLGKANFLRQVMAQYNVNKPLLLTEGGLICSTNWSPAECTNPAPAFFESQADYVPWLYARTKAEGFLGTVWYVMDGPGWLNGGLLDAAQQPRPAYQALQALIPLLDRTVYTGRVELFSGVNGYQFSKKGKTVWVLLPADQASKTIDIPVTASNVLDKYGSPIQPQNGQVTTSSPIYIEFNQ